MRWSNLYDKYPSWCEKTPRIFSSSQSQSFDCLSMIKEHKKQVGVKLSVLQSFAQKERR